MPKFSLPVVGKSKKNQDDKGDERKPLVATPKSPRNAMYSGPQRPTRTSSSSSHGNMPMSSMPRSPSLNSDISMDAPIKIRPGMPHGPPSPVVPATLDIDFNQVPFLFFTRVADQWKVPFIQGTALVTLGLLCPCLFIFFIFLCANSMEQQQQQSKAEQQRKKQNYFFAGAFLMTFIKDMMIVALALQGTFATDAYSYVLVFSLVMYCWFLFLFVLPLAVFYFADVRYEFGFDSDRKTLIKGFSTIFFSNKTKYQQAQKVEAQDNYFLENYRFLARVQCAMDEFTFVLKTTRKSLIIVAIIASVIFALVHAFVPCFLQLKDYTYLVNHTHTNFVNSTIINMLNSTINGTNINGTTINVTDSHVERVHHDAHFLTVVSISTLNSLIVSLIAAPYFIYVVLWKMAVLREWKRFNQNERDARKTLVNGGPQGIAMWWKIRQTLKMFSNGVSLTASIGKVTCVVAMVFVSFLSASIIMVVFGGKMETPNSKYEIVPLLLDAIFLYGLLLLIGILTIMADGEKKLSVDLIELKQLNVSYELGHLMNLEQEAIEFEPGVKVKVRVIRGCLMLLQELTSTMENLEKGTSSKLTILCLAVSTIFILPCLGLAFNFLTSSVATEIVEAT